MFKDLEKNEFQLKPRETKELVFDLKIGKDFTKAEVQKSNNNTILISVYADGTLIGGMSYYLDADLKIPINEVIKKQDTDCAKCSDNAKDLLKCLNITNQDVKKVIVKKISIDIEMNDKDCNCL